MCSPYLGRAGLALCLPGSWWWQSGEKTCPAFRRSLCPQCLSPPVLSLQPLNLHSICY